MTESQRVRLDIAYDGTDFHGWAPQRELRTVAGVIEEKLSLIARTPISLTVAGRTDAGVHATGQVAHADMPISVFEQRGVNEPADLTRRMAKLLPEDIRINAISGVPQGFDARFSALRRHYRYRISTAVGGPLPLRRKDTAAWHRPVDLEKMQDAAQFLVGLHNFAAYCRPREGATTIRELQLFNWKEVSTAEEPKTYEALVSADAFCWSMVRSLVGACLAVGEGRRSGDFTQRMLQEKKRSSLIPVAPACGLTLIGVDYPPEEELAARAEKTRERRSDFEVTAAEGG